MYKNLQSRFKVLVIKWRHHLKLFAAMLNNDTQEPCYPSTFPKKSYNATKDETDMENPGVKNSG